MPICNFFFACIFQRFLQNRDCFIKTVNTQHDCMDQFKKDMSKIVTIDRSKYGLKLRCGCW